MQNFRFETAFEEQASRTPEAIALRSLQGTITYAELEARANRVANHLRTLSVSTGAFVGLHVERSIDYVAALLGILKADAAVVPLPPSWPADRVTEILQFARLDLVIDAETTPLAADTDARTLRLEKALRGDGTASPQAGRESNHPAFVICSSGSTGTPKMIVRSHRSFLHRLQWTWQEHPFSSNDVCVQKSFQATTHSLYELFEPLLRGVAVRIVPDESLRDLAGFWSLLSAERVTRLLIVPSMLQATLDLPGFVAPPLRVMILMGEHVPARLASRVVTSFPSDTKIYSIYGSSEASSTLVTDLRDARPPELDPPLGVPISPDVRAWVLDENLQPVASGGIGMLHIAGSPLFTEYFRNPEGTEATLEARRGPERLYRTGDNVRVEQDGHIVFAGRADGVVKVRGFRVDVGEVERILSRGPGVRQCVVVPHPDATSASTLLGYVSPADLPTPVLFAWLRAHLPAYMVPSTIVPVEEFPRTPSGKVDRRRLMTDYRPATVDLSTLVYHSETERTVASLWAQLLGLEAVERSRSFFEIGGTSLTVFALVHRLREVFGLTSQQLGAAAIYNWPTLSELAAAIDRARSGDVSVAASQQEAILVPLKQGSAAGLPPLFVVSSAGGTLGAYERVVRAMKTPRDVVGLRDPFLSGGRDLSEGFQRWVQRYTDAVRRKQPRGPYHILAYSSAGVFGYEIAQQLRADGEDVAMLALVDPVAMDIKSPMRFGHWALWARFKPDWASRIVRWSGQLRAFALPYMLRTRRGAHNANDFTMSESEFKEYLLWARTDRENIVRFATLLELNTGHAFAIKDAELESIAPSAYMDRLHTKVARVDANIDSEMIERALDQYDLQVRSQHHYRLQRYDGAVHVYDPAGPQGGLIAAQLRPHVRKLYARSLALEAHTDEVRTLLEIFPDGLKKHYSCMRNDAFAERLGAELDLALEACAKRA